MTGWTPLDRLLNWITKHEVRFFMYCVVGYVLISWLVD
jgi:hypothetical protein